MLVTLLTVAALLTACGSATGSRTSLVITPETKLALGTLKLEGTPQAVDKATAAKLLPLWQLLQQLSSGTSTAPQEVTAVLDQIQATMTPEQSQAIDSMQITQADFAAAFQQARGATSAGSAGGTRPSGAGGGNRGGGGGGQAFFFGGGGAPGAPPPGGGFAGGGFAGGGFAGGGAGTGGTGTPSATQGSSSSNSQGAANRSATFVVGVVVRLLESKIGT
jgi:hypothetical protein